MASEGKHLKSDRFYGWYVVAASFAILFFTSGARMSFGVMFKPMIEEFGWARGALSFAFFLNMILYALSLIIVGRFYDRFGPKWVMVISTAFLSGGYMLVSIIDSLWQFLICYGIIAGIGLGGPSVTVMAAVTSKWFTKWRGLAISLALSGYSVGQFVIIPIITIIVSRYGWRVSYFAIGLIMLLVNVAMALWVIKGDPGDLGQKPFGHEDRENIKVEAEEINSGENLRDLALWEAMGTRSFWLFLTVMFICGSGDFLVTTHLIPFATDQGIPAITAGNMLAWLGLMSLAGILVAGPVSDLIGNKTPIGLTFLLRFALFLLILKYHNLVSFYVFALGFGFTLLITGPLNTTLIGKLYGVSHLGLISGFITTIHHVGGGFWAYMGGVIFDKTGRYWLAFIISTIMALVAVICTILIAERRHEVKRKTG